MPGGMDNSVVPVPQYHQWWPASFKVQLSCIGEIIAGVRGQRDAAIAPQEGESGDERCQDGTIRASWRSTVIRSRETKRAKGSTARLFGQGSVATLGRHLVFKGVSITYDNKRVQSRPSHVTGASQLGHTAETGLCSRNVDQTSHATKLGDEQTPNTKNERERGWKTRNRHHIGFLTIMNI
ncbi:uncharacterized protein BCR38DRAFT_404545 [Pseudomassariella vexata]|uniref:Uncharacterized protein n=1 Tax=Pseudomassariella vexata TaxID=1141098 RepID=A0A1Y2EIQ6_9PEZI|nr:uncharacterized protein BCR38DRAFT_404545 [Pseudomassariella vexata]ORY71461.1 hypothetical protein BCR38DRAFT_404545 [Pseudomassariella vexata]